MLFMVRDPGIKSVNMLLSLLPIVFLTMLFAVAPMPSIADVMLPSTKTHSPSTQSTTTKSGQSTTTQPSGENCVDDGRLLDSALAGMMGALIIILIWHVIRLCCCKPRPVQQQYPPQGPPVSSNVGTTSVRSTTEPSVRSTTASERIHGGTQKSKTESVRSRTESQKKAIGSGYVSTGTTGTTSSSMRNTSGTK